MHVLRARCRTWSVRHARHVAGGTVQRAGHCVKITNSAVHSCRHRSNHQQARGELKPALDDAGPHRSRSSTLSSAETVDAPTLPVPPRTRTRLPLLCSRRCARSRASAGEGPLPFCCAAAVLNWLPRRRSKRRQAFDMRLRSSEERSCRLGWGSSQDVSDRVRREQGLWMRACCCSDPHCSICVEAGPCRRAGGSAQTIGW